MVMRSLKGRFKGSEFIFKAAVFAICVLTVAVVVYPLYFIVIASFSDPVAVRSGEVWLFPKSVTLQGYQKIFENERIWLGYVNTIIYTVAGSLFGMLVTLPTAYALSRKDFRFRKPLSIYFIFTMFFSGGLIPTYMIVNKVGITNTAWVMIILWGFNTYNMIIARTFFEANVPGELLDAARMDGCGTTRFFLRVVLPLSQAIVSVIFLFNVVWKWNEYFTALIYLRDQSLMPLQIVLRDILLQNDMFKNGQGASGASTIANLGDLIKFGIIIVSTLPVMVMYPFLQKYFQKGIMIGAVKG
jgi:putative aldouronate transport system permease protein